MDVNKAKQASALMQKIEENIEKVFIGKKKQIEYLLIGLMSGLHILIEDIPGVGKTTLAKCLAASVSLDFSRIQFTPDLLPGDIIGMNIWDVNEKKFVLKKGAVMHQFILADEINRASPRTQSSLLEVMQEYAVSIDGITNVVPQPFFVIATQNPSTFRGTFMLPEAELDRFGLSFSIGYVSADEEESILDIKAGVDPFKILDAVAKPQDIVDVRNLVDEIYVAQEIKTFVISIAQRSRKSRFIKLPISTRAAQHLILAAKARALLNKRSFVIPEDIINLSICVLSHRIVISTEARMENKKVHEIIENIVNSVKVPVGIK